MAKLEHGAGSEGEASPDLGLFLSPQASLCQHFPFSSAHCRQCQCLVPGWLLLWVSHCLSLPLAEDGAALEWPLGSVLGEDFGNRAAESLGRGQEPGQPMKPNVQTLLVGTEGPSDALSPSVAAAGDTEPPNGHPQPPGSVVPTCLPIHLWEAVGRPAHNGRVSGHKDSQVTHPTSATFVTSTDIQEPSPSTGTRVHIFCKLTHTHNPVDRLRAPRRRAVTSSENGLNS